MRTVTYFKLVLHMNAISVFRWAGEEERREPKDVDESLSLPQKKPGRLFEACLGATHYCTRHFQCCIFFRLWLTTNEKNPPTWIVGTNVGISSSSEPLSTVVVQNPLKGHQSATLLCRIHYYLQHNPTHVILLIEILGTAHRLY